MRIRLVCRRSRVRSSSPAKHYFVEINHSLPTLPLIQIRQLSVAGERICRFDISMPRKNVVRLTDRLDMTIVVDLDVNPQTNQIKPSICDTQSNCKSYVHASVPTQNIDMLEKRVPGVRFTKVFMT